MKTDATKQAPKTDNDGGFLDFLTRIVRVPKRELDEQERIDARNKERRKNNRPAKPGHIVPTTQNPPR